MPVLLSACGPEGPGPLRTGARTTTAGQLELLPLCPHRWPGAGSFVPGVDLVAVTSARSQPHTLVRGKINEARA